MITLAIKVGARDIQNDKLTAFMILNETMEVSEDAINPLEKVKQRSFTISCDQYAKIGMPKPTVFEMKEEGVTEVHREEYTFAHKVSNEALFEKWLEKLKTL